MNIREWAIFFFLVAAALVCGMYKLNAQTADLESEVLTRHYKSEFRTVVYRTPNTTDPLQGISGEQLQILKYLGCRGADCRLEEVNEHGTQGR